MRSFVMMTFIGQYFVLYNIHNFKCCDHLTETLSRNKRHASKYEGFDRGALSCTYEYAITPNSS